MTNDERLAHALRLKFKLPPQEPSELQLSQIKQEILQLQLQRSDKIPSLDDWKATVQRYCPNAGRYKYAGLDNSDLNTLLALAMMSAQGESTE